jgi:hypothetical protein
MGLNTFMDEYLTERRGNEDSGTGITVLSMRDNAAIGRISRTVFVECLTCGYEPPSGIMPHGRCPKCQGYGWHHALRYTALPTPSDSVNDETMEASNNEKGPIPA